MTLRSLKYGNYGIFLIMGNAGFCPSTVVVLIVVDTHVSPYDCTHTMIGLSIYIYIHSSGLLRSF